MERAAKENIHDRRFMALKNPFHINAISVTFAMDM
jgi:hypothetical protein